MVAIGKSKVKFSNIEWKITVPEGSFVLNAVSPKPLHNRVFEKALQVLCDLKSGFISLCKMAWQHGADDPRRFSHPIKVGISLVLVSLFYFITVLYNGTGKEATWAIMTVVVIFEFSAGATLCKGLNRMTATLLAAVLAYAVNVVAREAGHKAEPVIIGAVVFLFSVSSTFVRLFPKIKAKYDYGYMIFILTFSFIAVSGYRETNLFGTAYKRLETIIIGCIICLLTSLLICPVWIGEDLHKLIISNMESLAESLEECAAQYFQESSDDDSDNVNVSIGYRCVLNSKAHEETLANFARWEFLPHGQFRLRYPWKQYVKIGSRMRYCAYCVEVLNVCLNSEIQTPCCLREHLKAPCLNIAAESSRVIRELAHSIKTMTRSTRIDLMTDRLNRAVDELNSCLTSREELFIDTKSWQIGEECQVGKNETIKGVAFMDTLPLATVACLLIEIVPRLHTLSWECLQISLIITLQETSHPPRCKLRRLEWNQLYGDGPFERKTPDTLPIVFMRNPIALKYSATHPLLLTGR